MATFVIEGGNPLSGEVTPMPNKNAILPLIPAAVLCDEPVTFSNVPKSSAVRIMLAAYKEVGGKVAYLRGGKIRLDSSEINKHTISKELVKKEKATIMFLGPLLVRFNKAELGEAGGCKLGNRPLDTLIQGLESLGAYANPDNIYQLEAKNGMNGNDNIWQIEASVTGTESLIMTAARSKGRTMIYNAACEPHIQDLCNFLNSVGARIKGVGTNLLEIEGVDTLGGGEWEVIPDHIDIGGLIVAAAITGGEMLIKNAIPQHMKHILMFYDKVSVKTEIQGNDIFVPGNQKLHCKPNLKGDIDKINAQVWPTGFPADLIPQAVVLAVMASGNIRVQNLMYESGLFFVEDLIKMRAKLVLSHPMEVVTLGPSKLKGATVSAPTVLQSAHAVAIAAFAAEGTTKILNSGIISRRYPEFVETYKSLGGKIKQVR